MRVLSIIFYITVSNILFSQKEDYVWIMGNNGGSTIEKMKADTVVKRFWPFNLNFLTEPMHIDYDLNRRSMFIGTCSSISSKFGVPFIYSHGRSLWAANNNLATNGDTINYDSYWENFNVGPNFNLGTILFQGMIMLPYPSHPDSVLYITAKFDNDESYQSGFYWGIVSGYVSNQPFVVAKDNYVHIGRMKPGRIKAIKHANGRDWWIIMVNPLYALE